MAGEIPGLRVVVEIDTSGVTAGVSKVNEGLKSVSSEAEKTGGKMRELKDLMLGVFGGNLLTSGVMGLEKTLEEMNLAVQDAQIESNRLATALKNSGNATEENTKLVEDNVKSYADLGFTHAQAAQAMGTLITATGNVTESTKLMSMAADLARYKHEDLNTAATTLARGTQGSVKAFKELGITLDSTLPKNEAIAKAFDQLNTKIGGQATAYTHTFAGEIAVLKEKFNEVAVTIGNVVFPIVTKIIEAFNTLWNVIKPFSGDLMILTGVIGGAIAAYKAWQAVTTGLEMVQRGYLVTMTLLKGAKLEDVVATDAQTASQKALAFVINQNPWAKVIEVIALVVGALVELYKHNSYIRDIMITVAEAGVKGFGYIVGAVGELVKAITYVISGPLLLLLKGLSLIHAPGAKDAYNSLTGAIKDMGKGFDDTAKKIYAASDALDKYRKVSADTRNAPGSNASAFDTSGIIGSVPGGDTVKGATAAAKKKATELAKELDTIKKLYADYDAVLVDRQNKMDAALKTKMERDTAAAEAFNTKAADLQTRHDDAMQAAQDAFDTKSADAHQAYNDKIQQLDDDFTAKQLDLLAAKNDKIAALQQTYADKATQLQLNATNQQNAIVDKSIGLLTSAWQNATKIDVGTLFVDYGRTSEGLKTALTRQLNEVLKLQKDAGQLAAAGYSQTFIQEVLSKGPQIGDQMAQAVLNATPDTAAQIKDLYSQISDVSQSGLNSLATQMNNGANLATQALINEYAQVGITLKQQLVDNANSLQDAIAKENASYANALDAATDAHTKAAAAAQATLDKALTDAQTALTTAQEKANKALADGLKSAQETLTTALKASQTAFDNSIKAISDSTNKQLDALITKIDTAAAKIKSLGGTVPTAPTPQIPTVTIPVPQSFIPSATPQADTAGTIFTGGTQLGSGAIAGSTDTATGEKVFIPAAGAPTINITGFNLTDPAATGSAVAWAVKTSSDVTFATTLDSKLSRGDARAL